MYGMDDAGGRRFAMSGCVPGTAAQSGQVQAGEYATALLGYSEGEKAVCPQRLQVRTGGAQPRVTLLFCCAAYAMR